MLFVQKRMKTMVEKRDSLMRKTLERKESKSFQGLKHYLPPKAALNYHFGS